MLPLASFGHITKPTNELCELVNMIPYRELEKYHRYVKSIDVSAYINEVTMVCVSPESPDMVPLSSSHRVGEIASQGMAMFIHMPEV